MNKTPAYVIISGVFLILTGIVFGYSCFFYPNKHPVACMVRERTGKNCATCGFSRAFSSYTHFKFEEGKSYNPLSWHVFIFFAAQMMIRKFVVIWYLFTKRNFHQTWIKADVFISISAFLLAFLPILFKSF